MTRYRHLITDDNRKWWTLGAMCFALFMVMLDNTVVNVALPSIQRELHAHISQLEWVINGYTLTFAVLIATGGRLGDIFGRRLMFLTGVIIFAITSATAGLAQDSAMLIGSRAIQGIGAALMMPATLSIITHTFPAAERGRAIGIWAGVSALALSIGPVVGGALTEYVSWRAIFFINLPVAVAAVAATVFAVRESRDETVDRHVDYPGIVALTASLTAIILALIEGNSWGWGSTRHRLAAGRWCDRAGGICRHRAAGYVTHGRVRALPDPSVHRLQPDRLHHHLRHDGHLLLHGDLHAGHPRLQRTGGRGSVPADDDGDRGGRTRSRVGSPTAWALAFR